MAQMNNSLIPNYVSTPTGYDITGVGSFARVSNILAMANFGNDILEGWKKKQRRKAFDLGVSDLLCDSDIVSHSSKDLLDLWDSSYNAPDNITSNSAEFGTLLHEFLEVYLTTGVMQEVKKHPYADTSICRQSMIKFVNDWNLGPHTTFKAECLIWSSVYNYAGCIDYIAVKDGKVYILDWKTTGHLHSKYLLQLSAYWVALEERAKEYNLPGPIEHVYLVRFDKARPYYEYIDFGREQMLQYFEVFKSLINIYNFSKRISL